MPEKIALDRRLKKAPECETLHQAVAAECQTARVVWPPSVELETLLETPPEPCRLEAPLLRLIAASMAKVTPASLRVRASARLLSLTEPAATSGCPWALRVASAVFEGASGNIPAGSAATWASLGLLVVLEKSTSVRTLQAATQLIQRAAAADPQVVQQVMSTEGDSLRLATVLAIVGGSAGTQRIISVLERHLESASDQKDVYNFLMHPSIRSALGNDGREKMCARLVVAAVKLVQEESRHGASALRALVHLEPTRDIVESLWPRLEDPAVFKSLAKQPLLLPMLEDVAAVCVGEPFRDSWLFRQLLGCDGSPEMQAAGLRVAARVAPELRLGALGDFARKVALQLAVAPGDQLLDACLAADALASLPDLAIKVDWASEAVAVLLGAASSCELVESPRRAAAFRALDRWLTLGRPLNREQHQVAVEAAARHIASTDDETACAACAFLFHEPSATPTEHLLHLLDQIGSSVWPDAARLAMMVAVKDETVRQALDSTRALRSAAFAGNCLGSRSAAEQVVELLTAPGAVVSDAVADCGHLDCYDC